MLELNIMILDHFFAGRDVVDLETKASVDAVSGLVDEGKMTGHALGFEGLRRRRWRGRSLTIEERMSATAVLALDLLRAIRGVMVAGTTDAAELRILDFAIGALVAENTTVGTAHLRVFVLAVITLVSKLFTFVALLTR
jgi:hypothetical protein